MSDRKERAYHTRAPANHPHSYESAGVEPKGRLTQVSAHWLKHFFIPYQVSALVNTFQQEENTNIAVTVE